jgi:hypothetical protein
MTISDSLRQQVRSVGKNRCAYCLVEDQYVYAPMEIDHIIPQADGGTDDEENLCLACPSCNGFKGSQTRGVDPETGDRISLFNPRTQIWSEHFGWGEDNATIIGLTNYGRVTVNVLQLNFPPNLELRKLFVKIGWYPPKN